MHVDFQTTICMTISDFHTLCETTKNMDTVTEEQVKSCIAELGPIASHILTKWEANHGFSDNPQALHPVTKLVTLGLDSTSRFCVDRELVSFASCNEDTARQHIRFIRWCMSTATDTAVDEIIGSEHAAKVWNMLDETCSRDGALFLAAVKELSSGTLKDACFLLIANN